MEVRASWLPLGKQESKGRACVDNLRAEQNGFVAMVVRIAAGREAKQEEHSVWVTNSTELSGKKPINLNRMLWVMAMFSPV